MNGFFSSVGAFNQSVLYGRLLWIHGAERFSVTLCLVVMGRLVSGLAVDIRTLDFCFFVGIVFLLVRLLILHLEFLWSIDIRCLVRMRLVLAARRFALSRACPCGFLFFLPSLFPFGGSAGAGASLLAPLLSLVRSGHGFDGAGVSLPMTRSLLAPASPSLRTPPLPPRRSRPPLLPAVSFSFSSFLSSAFLSAFLFFCRSVFFLSVWREEWNYVWQALGLLSILCCFVMPGWR